MKQHPLKKARRKNSGWRYRGIKADAAALGVNRASLYRALRGEWVLPGLLLRYKNLKRAQRRAMK